MLRFRDLSFSQLDHLPEDGLKNVQKLFLNETHNLKKLPSIFVFTNLEEAHLTYPYHCCLFKVSFIFFSKSSQKIRHIFFQHAKVSQQYKESGQYRGNIDELREKYCSADSTTTEPTSPAEESSTIQHRITEQSSTFDPMRLFTEPKYLFRKKRKIKVRSLWQLSTLLCCRSLANKCFLCRRNPNGAIWSNLNLNTLLGVIRNPIRKAELQCTMLTILQQKTGGVYGAIWIP